MAGEVIVDALPYIDQGYDEPGVREAVNNKSCVLFFSSQLNIYAAKKFSRISSLEDNLRSYSVF